MSRGCYETGPHLAGRQLIRAALPPFQRGGARKGTNNAEGSSPRQDITASLQRHSPARLQSAGPGATPTPADRPHGRSSHGTPPPRPPPPPPRAQRSPGAQPALTSSISRSRMLGGCGVPLAPSTATLITCSSRHRIAAATAAMATARGAAGPVPAAGTGRAAFPAGRRGGARPAE